MDDLVKFYKDQYSADRIKVVIQTKTSDNMTELRKWAETSFSKIENKNLGLQDFSKIARDGSTKSPAVG